MVDIEELRKLDIGDIIIYKKSYSGVAAGVGIVKLFNILHNKKDDKEFILCKDPYKYNTQDYYVETQYVDKILCKVKVLCHNCLLLATCNKLNKSYECYISREDYNHVP